MNECPSRQQLEWLLAERLEPEARKAIGEHIGQCAHCQQTLDRLTQDESIVDPGGPEKGQGIGRTDPTLSSLLDRLRQARPRTGSSLSTHGQGNMEWLDLWAAPGEQEAPRVLGVYALLESIGSGATGVVFRARDTKLGREVAVKVLRGELAATTSGRARFEREARAAASLRHDQIVTVHDVGAEAHGPAYLVMELIPGEPLSEQLRRQGAFESRGAATLAQQVALGLAAAHVKGLIHRDIKPSNIMIDQATGRPKITDFGLALCLEGEAPTMTIEGEVLGTPAYMSPEQAQGLSHQVDARSDIYSLGVVLYQLLTGELPYSGGARVLLYHVLHEEPRPMKSPRGPIPRDLQTITLKCLAKKPAERYQSAQELADDLARWLAGAPILARPRGPLARLWRQARRRPVAAALVLALLLIAPLGVYGLVKLQDLNRVKNARDQIARLITDGDQALDDDELEQARTLYTEALDRAHRMAAAEPEGIEFQTQLAMTYQRMGHLEELHADYPKARSWYDQAVGMLQRLAAAGQLRHRPADLERLKDVEQRAQLCKDSERAVEDLEWAAGQTDGQTLLLNRVEALIRLGRVGEVPGTAERLRSLAPTDPVNLYNVACAYSLAAAACHPEDAEVEPPPGDKGQARKYADLAVAALKEAIERGFRQIDFLKSDKDLDAIRGHPGYQEAIRPLEPKER